MKDIEVKGDPEDFNPDGSLTDRAMEKVWSRGRLIPEPMPWWFFPVFVANAVIGLAAIAYFQ